MSSTWLEMKHKLDEVMQLISDSMNDQSEKILGIHEACDLLIDGLHDVHLLRMCDGDRIPLIFIDYIRALIVASRLLITLKNSCYNGYDCDNFELDYYTRCELRCRLMIQRFADNTLLPCSNYALIRECLDVNGLPDAVILDDDEVYAISDSQSEYLTCLSA